MLEVIEEAVIDSIKILPFLFITYLIMEYIEHKTSEKSKDMIKKSGKIGPLIGSLLGIFPQMWIFSFSNKPICSKSNNTRNIDSSIFINIR